MFDPNERIRWIAQFDNRRRSNAEIMTEELRHFRHIWNGLTQDERAFLVGRDDAAAIPPRLESYFLPDHESNSLNDIGEFLLFSANINVMPLSPG